MVIVGDVADGGRERGAPSPQSSPRTGEEGKGVFPHPFDKLRVNGREEGG